MQAARMALQRLNQILSDNSGRIDGILVGLEKVVGGGEKEKPKPIYDLTLAAKPSGPAKVDQNTQLVVGEPAAVVALQTQRIIARSPSGEIAPVGDAQWADTLPKFLQQKLIQAYEDEGYLAAVLPPLDQAKPNYQLVIDLRNFAVVSAPEQAADIEFSAKIMADDGRIVGAQFFHVSAPAKGDNADAIVVAFNQAFGQIAGELIAWTRKTITT